MKKHALARFELEVFFGSSLGCRAWCPDNGGLNTPSPDREAHVTDHWLREVGRHRRVRAILSRMPSGYAVLSEALSPRRPLPQQLLHQLGGDEHVARLVPSTWVMREAYDRQSEAPDYEAFVVLVARGGKHEELRDKAIAAATLLLDQALDDYTTLRRTREAA